MSENTKILQDQSNIRIAKSAFNRMLFSTIRKVVGFGLLSIIIIYTSFAATIVRFIPTDDSGIVLVKNNTFTGGVIPAGENVFVSFNQEQKTSMGDRLQQAFTLHNGTGEVQVLAGPYGKITWAEPGIIAVDNEPLNVNYPNEPNQEFLENDYIVICISGGCEPGSTFIISSENIFGIPISGGS